MNCLEKNRFYNALLTTYKKRYREATEKCHIICVPINESYDWRVVNEKFISAHILKASPLLKSHFIAANHKHNFDVEIDGQLLRVTRGFGDRNVETIHILSEEIAYNAQNKEYRILVSEHPLINSSNRRLDCDPKNGNKQNDSLVSFDDCQTFLSNISREFTDDLKAKVDKLMTTYIVLPNYIDDAASRIKAVIDWGIQNFKSVASLPEMATNDCPIESAVESYVIGLTHPKLLVAINKCFESDDKLLYEKFVELNKRTINPVDFGAQEAFECFTINSIITEELSKLDQSLITPLEKLNCLRLTLDLMQTNLMKSVENKFIKRDSICIMSDDLIATLICVLTAVKPKRFESEINFIQTFSWNLPQMNELGYSLVTFEVVKQFIKSYDLNETNPSKADSRPLDRADSTGYRSTAFSHISSPLDRDLEKISKMIDKSIALTSTQSNTSNSEPNEELGEFLGSLSRNSFAIGFGKQC